MRRKIVAGNWKMTMNNQESLKLIKEISKVVEDSKVEVIVSPSFTSLYSVSNELSGSTIKVSAQNMSSQKKGAFTGEVSSDMLLAIGVNTVILGHSERRQYYGETNEIISKKVKLAVENNMDVILCVGETLDDRKSNNYFSIVKTQVEECIFALTNDEMKNVVIAYEPVWAIGTGETASSEQAQEIHLFIRKLINDKYGKATADKTPILYGGSVKPNNAKELFSKSDIDGGLIGGAALNANDFNGIITSF